MEITLRQLACLVAIADHGSVSAAADALDISQPGVTHQLQLLENALGYRLVNRTYRGAEIREEAHMVVERARQVLNGVAHLGDDLVDPRVIRGTVQLGIIPTASATRFPALYRRIVTNYSEVTVILHEGKSEDMVQAVRQGDLHLAVVSLPLLFSDIEVDPLWREELVVVTPLYSDLEETVDIEQLQSLPFIGLEVGTGLQRRVLEIFHRVGIQPRLVFQASSISTAIGFVSAKVGVSVVPLDVARIYAGANLVEIRHLQPAVFRQLVLVHRPFDVLPMAPKVIGQYFLQYSRRLSAGI